MKIKKLTALLLALTLCLVLLAACGGNREDTGASTEAPASGAPVQPAETNGDAQTGTGSINTGDPQTIDDPAAPGEDQPPVPVSTAGIDTQAPTQPARQEPTAPTEQTLPTEADSAEDLPGSDVIPGEDSGEDLTAEEDLDSAEDLP